MAVYLATEQPLPEREREPLHLEPAAPETVQRLRRHLRLPHVYFVASHEGCGCGFIQDSEGPDEDEAARAASLSALRELVREAAARSPVEVFVGFDGEEATEPEHSVTLTDPEELQVRWGDRVLYCVTPP